MTRLPFARRSTRVDVRAMPLEALPHAIEIEAGGLQAPLEFRSDCSVATQQALHQRTQAGIALVEHIDPSIAAARACLGITIAAAPHHGGERLLASEGHAPPCASASAHAQLVHTCRRG